jgi:Arc/MetJ-type ribon-helix-helix transcriptional regulator
MNPALNEQMTPEIMQAIITRAAARSMSINDYLRDLLGLTGGESQEAETMDEELRRLINEGVESGPGIDAELIFSRLRAKYSRRKN